MPDTATTPAFTDVDNGLPAEEEPEAAATMESLPIDEPEEDDEQPTETPPVPSPFDITRNVIYDPPHVSPRIRAQDGVLLACFQPLVELEERDYLEIVIRHEAHDDIRRRLDQYGVLDKQLSPDLDGIAKWLKYRVFESEGSI